MTKIGFIGLGNMGGPMALNLLKNGHQLKVFDLSEDAMQKLGSQGAQLASDAADAVSDVEAVVTMLPAGEHVRAIYQGKDGILGAASQGTLFMDCSTIDVATARAVGEVAEEAGMMMVDAPVSGGVAAAEAGTLTFMVGGSESAFERAQPILGAMGQKIIHAGPSGAGQAAKVCNNMLLGITMIGTCEAFLLADRLGLERQKLFDIASNASGQNWSLTNYCPVPGPVPTSPANREYQPGFTVAMMLKDLKLAQDAAQETGATTPLGAKAMSVYAKFDEAGQGALDFSGIIKMLEGDA